MRALAILFVLLIAALQYPMWLGKGGWLQVRELGRGVAKAHDDNAVLKVRNEALDADVRDLKTGYEAIEERARSELGMIRHDEVFFQIQPEPPVAGAKSLSAKGVASTATLKNDSAAASAARVR